MRPGAAAGALWFLALSSGLPQDKKPPVDQEKVDAAIGSGAAWLKGQSGFAINQDIYLTWERTNQPSFHQRCVELVLLTLLHAGVDRNDPEFKKMLDAMLAAKLETTYRTALQAMVLHKLDARGYQARIAQCGQTLIDSQGPSGQWCYGHSTDLGAIPAAREEPAVKTGKVSKNPPGAPAEPPLPKIALSKRKPGCSLGDNSNSQYAALGLRACLESGVLIPPDVLRKAKEAWERSQKPDGSWGYGGPGNVRQAETPGAPTYGSMTAGGIAALCILKHYLKEPVKGDSKIVSAQNWLAKNFTVAENPFYRNHHHFYYLYAMERAGDLYGNESFGPHAWYPAGAKWLIDKQQTDGQWWDNSRVENNVVATCFAVLFLRRATAPLPKIATGAGK
jgi:hypothetical protein